MASLLYLLLTRRLMAGQYYIERYAAKGEMRQLPPTALQKLRRRFGGGEER